MSPVSVAHSVHLAFSRNGACMLQRGFVYHKKESNSAQGEDHVLRGVALNYRKAMVAKEAFYSKSPKKRLHGWFYEITFSMEI